MNKLFVCLVLMCVGCASTNAPGGDPCKERGFDDWVSFYALRAKAQSSWDKAYAPAYGWLEDVARACHPERFDDGLEEVEDEPVHVHRCQDIPSEGFDPSYLAECDLLSMDSYDEIEIE